LYKVFQIFLIRSAVCTTRYSCGGRATRIATKAARLNASIGRISMRSAAAGGLVADVFSGSPWFDRGLRKGAQPQSSVAAQTLLALPALFAVVVQRSCRQTNRRVWNEIDGGPPARLDQSGSQSLGRHSSHMTLGIIEAARSYEAERGIE
jgi:hypothetical protein